MRLRYTKDPFVPPKHFQCFILFHFFQSLSEAQSLLTAQFNLRKDDPFFGPLDGVVQYLDDRLIIVRENQVSPICTESTNSRQSSPQQPHTASEYYRLYTYFSSRHAQGVLNRQQAKLHKRVPIDPLWYPATQRQPGRQHLFAVVILIVVLPFDS